MTPSSTPREQRPRVSDDEPVVRLVQLQLCDACIDGVGQECHTPGCAMFLHRVDLPFHREVIEIVEDDRQATIAQRDAEIARLREALATARYNAWIEGRNAAAHAAQASGASVARDQFVMMGPAIYLRAAVNAIRALAPPAAADGGRDG